MSDNQRSMLAHLRTLLVVTLISAMVWLLAESRMVRSRTIEAQISITSVEPSGGVEFVVRQVPGLALVRSVAIELEGSTGGLDRFMRQLQNRIELRLGREIPPTPGEYTLDLRGVIRSTPDLDVQGVTIKSVAPAEIVIEVDELETRELPVRVLMPEGVQTDGSYRVEPSSVRLRAPSAMLADLPAEFATVTLSLAQISQLTPGRLETVPGAVVEIEGVTGGDWATTIEPSQVDVLLTLRTVSQQLELDPLPVQVLLAPGEVGSWRVEIEETDRDLVGVRVEGPVEGIEALRSKTVRPQAFVSLSFEDLEREIGSKPAQIMNLPPGCRVVSPERVVGLRIIRVPAERPAGSDENPDS